MGLRQGSHNLIVLSDAPLANLWQRPSEAVRLRRQLGLAHCSPCRPTQALRATTSQGWSGCVRNLQHKRTDQYERQQVQAKLSFTRQRSPVRWMLTPVPDRERPRCCLVIRDSRGLWLQSPLSPKMRVPGSQLNKHSGKRCCLGYWATQARKQIICTGLTFITSAAVKPELSAQGRGTYVSVAKGFRGHQQRSIQKTSLRTLSRTDRKRLPLAMATSTGSLRALRAAKG